MLEEQNDDYWKDRSETYDQIEWVSNTDLIRTLLDICGIDEDQVVLDIGCGTGSFTLNLAMYAKKVIAIDNSKAMIDYANKHSKEDNIEYHLVDARDLQMIEDNSIDLAIARMTFHHILEKESRLEVIKEVNRVLKPHGQLIICEMVPPSEDSIEYLENIFKYKEERVIFSTDDLSRLVSSVMKLDYILPYVMPDVSVNNWLIKNNISEENIKIITNLFLHSDSNFKELFRITLKNNPRDILVTWAFLILSASKVL